MSVGIDELFDMLSWNSDEETQKKGIELAKSVKCISVFFQPSGLEHGKDVWENCAKVLASHTDETLKCYSHELLVWLTDMNWPGAYTIFNRLLDFKDVEFLSLLITRCVKEALACDNQFWLGNIAALLDNERLNKDTLPKDIYDSLYCRYKEMIFKNERP